MKASELKLKLAKVPDDYVFVDDVEIYGFVMNHKRKEFSTNELSPAVVAFRTEIADLICAGKIELV